MKRHRLRVVAHDRPKWIEQFLDGQLYPEARRWTLRVWLQRAAALAAGAAVLGLTWVVCEVIVAIAVRLK